jgi:hypothetical protein
MVIRIGRDSIGQKPSLNPAAMPSHHGVAMDTTGITSIGGHVVDVELARWEARRTETTIRYASRVSALLAARPELRGISPLADTVEEAVRWAV